MGTSRNLLRLLAVLFLLNAVFAEAKSEAYPLRITVLSAETHAISTEPQVPKDCDLANYSAYCNGSRSSSSQSILLVQDADGKSYRIACTTDSRWSKCAPLPVGETFHARQEKQGFTVLYRSAQGKERKQFYQLVAEVPVSQPGAAAPAPPQAATAQPSSPPPAPAPPVASGQQGRSERIRCNFSSTPSGAEITVDGRYVGSTPSEIGLSTGTHVVILSLSGFTAWKRDLTIEADSVVNVTANLEKSQH